MQPLILVAAANREEFLVWCQECGVNPRERWLRHVSRRNQLLGMRNVTLILAGRWYTNKELERAVQEWCAIHNCKTSDLPLSITVG